MATKKPVRTFKLGRIQATVWQNDSEHRGEGLGIGIIDFSDQPVDGTVPERRVGEYLEAVVTNGLKSAKEFLGSRGRNGLPS